VILRTAWVVSATGSNFVKTMLRLGAERPQLRVVADQTGCPTSADDIARAILTILRGLPEGPYGTYHFVNRGEATWHDLAEAVFARAATHGRRAPAVEAIATSDYPTPAARPANSRLATDKIARDFGICPRDWHGAVDEIVDTLVKETAEI
jgi:dTDP-4-dehydrorhamnose reductase